MIGGILILLGGLFELALASAISSTFAFVDVGGLVLGGILGLATGALITICAAGMYLDPDRTTGAGIVIVLCSAVSLLSLLGGLLLGFLLALIGGILAIRFEESEPTSFARPLPAGPYAAPFIQPDPEGPRPVTVYVDPRELSVAARATPTGGLIPLTVQLAPAPSPRADRSGRDRIGCTSCGRVWALGQYSTCPNCGAVLAP